MKVLVTGSSGFLGGHTCEILTEAGHEVRGLVRPTSDTDHLKRLGVETVRGDLKDPDSLRRAVDGVDAVVHAAATKSGTEEEFVEATIRGTERFLSIADEAGVDRFVHISSISVYPLRRSAEPITENSPYETDEDMLNLYAESKREADRAAREYAADGNMEVIVLRPGILYGPRGETMLPRVGYALGRNWFVVIGNGKTRLPVCYVRNCAGAIRAALEQDEANSEAYNILDDEDFTQDEYVAALKKRVRPRLKRLHFPYSLARILGWASDALLGLVGRSTPLHPSHLYGCGHTVRYSNEKAKRQLGWQPQVPKGRALDETMEWFADREELSRRARPDLLGKPAEDEEPLDACVVGCGGIARSHLGTLVDMEHARVCGVCDVDGEAAASLADEFDVSGIYEDLHEMLEREEPDVLHILTPPQYHLDCARTAAEHGCSMLVEKPMALDAEEAGQIRDIAAERGVEVCVDHNHLYDPAMVKARRIIESGTLGRIVWVDSYYGFNLSNNPQSKYLQPGGGEHWTFDLPGKLYQNLLSHPLCLALEVLGTPEGLTAQGGYGKVVPHMPTDELRVMLEADEAGGLVSVSLAASPRFQYMTVFGTDGTLTVDLLNKWVSVQTIPRGVPSAVARALNNVCRATTLLWATFKGMVKVFAGRWTPFDGMDMLIRDYYAALQEGREPPVNADEGVRTMQLMDRIWREAGADVLSWPEDRSSEKRSE